MNARIKVMGWLREPLVHFLIAGLAIFAFNAMRGGVVDAGSRRIVLNESQVERLASYWMQTWRRPPTDAELDALIRDHIKEEIYNREARRLGLDIDDAVIRRRLRNKMEFLIGAEVENAVPRDADLQAVLDADVARYARDPTYSFDHVFVRGADAVAASRARAILAQLKAGREPDELGDPLPIPRSFEKTSAGDVARQFGDRFAAAFGEQKGAGWAGPVASEYGLHLVRIRERGAAVRPTLDDVRGAVERDWRTQTRERREAEAYKALLDGYDIKIERPR